MVSGVNIYANYHHTTPATNPGLNWAPWPRTRAISSIARVDPTHQRPINQAQIPWLALPNGTSGPYALD